MSVEAWQKCLESQTRKKRSTILLLCLAHRPEVVCESLLLSSLAAENFIATTIVLAFSKWKPDIGDVYKNACELASRAREDDNRLLLFSVLQQAGMVRDCLVLREELKIDVMARHFPLVELLVNAGVNLETTLNGPLHATISRMDLDLLKLFRKAKFATPISHAIGFVPNSASESDFIQLLDILGPRGIAGTPLDTHLVNAVRKRQTQLVQSLIKYGGSIEYQSASAIRISLENTDFDILKTLLTRDCSRKILSGVIPTVMNISPNPRRLEAFNMILNKGVVISKLRGPLREAVSQHGDVDLDLIRLLLHHKAPLDETEDPEKNVVFLAISRGLLPVLTYFVV